jgi:hypothetical protein
MRSLTLFILSILFVQCSTKYEDQGNENKLIDYEVVNSIDFKLAGDLNYELGFFNVFGDTLVAFDDDKAKIDVYSIQLEEHLFSINIKLDGPNGILRPDGIYIHNLDSIFCYSNEYQFVSLINRQAEIIGEISLPEFKLSQQINGVGGNYHYTPITYYRSGLIEIPFYYEEDKLYFHILASSHYSGMESLQTTYSTPMLVQFSVNDPSESNFLGYWPDSYQKNSELPNNPINDFIVNSNRIIISYYNDVTIQDVKEGQYFNVKSNFSKTEGITLFEQEEQSNPEKEFDAFKLDEGYVNILYDPFNKLYYRVFKLEQHTKAENSSIMPFKLEAEWSLIVMNEDFEIIGETKFPSKLYNFMNIILTVSCLVW